jgi:hypothetical protein
MPCIAPIDSTPLNAPWTFTNWARALSWTAARSYRPTTRGEVVEIIRQAEAAGRRVKWTGSVWSFMPTCVCSDDIIESDDIKGIVDRALVLDRLPLADPTRAERLVHVRGGTKIYNVNRLLYGLTEASNGGGLDEVDLGCGGTQRALHTLGGSGGQSLAGVMATGVHGGDLNLRPIADCVQAIHLIGPGGQEFWIERSAGLTAGTEADTQALLRALADADPAVKAELCNDVLVRKDDELFRAALVSVGRMGFVYAVVIETEAAFKLAETRRADTWETYRANLGAEAFTAFVAGKYYLNVLINPFARDGVHPCKVTERRRVPCSDPNVGMGARSTGPLEAICRRRDVRVFIPLLVAALAGLVAAVAGLAALAGALLGAAPGLATIPVVGWALAGAAYAAAAVALASIAALTVAIAALTGLVAFLALAGSMTPGELTAAIARFAYAFGMRDLMARVLTLLFDAGYPLESRTGVGWKIMDTYGYDGEDFCQKVDAMEIAFDVAAATGGGGYLAFIDEVLAVFADLFNRGIPIAGLLSLRYTQNTGALIGMSKFAATCHVEIPILKHFAGNAEFIARVQAAAIARGGVPHWGQWMDGYAGADIHRLHGEDLAAWRRSLTRLIREGGGGRFTFSNDFTTRYLLEPFDDTPISAVRFTITVGADSLGDTDHLRPNVSADVVRVSLRSGAFFQASLNEGAEWRAFTTHVRDVPVAAGTTWGDVEWVGIHHFAAGEDSNADNWMMDRIVISSISPAGDVREEVSLSGAPLWHFRKNEQQIWIHGIL